MRSVQKSPRRTAEPTRPRTTRLDWNARTRRYRPGWGTGRPTQSGTSISSSPRRLGPRQAHLGRSRHAKMDTMPWAPHPGAERSNRALDSVTQILDPLLVPLGFASGQVGITGGRGQIIFCRGEVNSADDDPGPGQRRKTPPWPPPALRRRRRLLAQPSPRPGPRSHVGRRQEPEWRTLAPQDSRRTVIGRDRGVLAPICSCLAEPRLA